MGRCGRYRHAIHQDSIQVARIIVDAIRSVESVQTNRDVVAWLIELNEYHMLYWASWWVANFTDRFPVQDQVNRAIMRVLHDAGSELLPTNIGE